MTGYIAGIVAAVVLTVFIFELLRRGILQEKFAALWLLVSVGLLVFAVFPAVLAWLARLLGIALPSNLLFLLAGLLLLFVSVQLSFEVSKVEGRTRRLAEEVALLHHEVDALADRLRDEQE